VLRSWILTYPRSNPVHAASVTATITVRTGSSPLPEFVSTVTTSRRLRIGVLFGGRSGEHEISLRSAESVIAALKAAGHEVVQIGITKDGNWLAGGDPLHSLQSGVRGNERLATLLPQPGHGGLVAVQDAGEVESSSLGSMDVVFPVLHGTYGEDGTVQGLLELASVPYVGTGVLASAVGMDKIFVKAYWRGLGLPIVDWVNTTRDRLELDPEPVLDQVERELGYPCFVKPANLGSSVGVGKATTRDELLAALRVAARYDSRLLIEKGIDARELEVAVLGNEEPEASVVGEVIANADFYSYRAKYLDDGALTMVPAEIPAETSTEVRRLAVEAFTVINGSGLARVDFFLERGSNRLYLNEINTMPGFTSISMYPKLWEASGVSFPELVDRLVKLAIERHAERTRNQTTFDAPE